MNKSLSVAKFYQNYKDKALIGSDRDIIWIRENIPEFIAWNDAQLEALGNDDFGQSQQRMTFQTPLNKEELLDYATFMTLYNLEPKHIYIWDCEDEILGIFEAYKTNQSLDKWKSLADERVVDVQRELDNATMEYKK